MNRLKFIALILSPLGCTSSREVKISYPVDPVKMKKHERKRRKKTGYERQYKRPK